MIVHTLDKNRQIVRKPLCGKLVKTIDNLKKPCLRPQGHDGGCNPFSDTPPQK